MMVSIPTSLMLLMFAVFLSLILHILREIPVTGDEVDINSLKYDKTELKAPVLSGLSLYYFSYIATHTVLQPLVSRLLLNDKGMHLVRAMAIQYPFTPPTFFPMKRLSAADHEKMEKQYAETNVAQLLRGGFSTPSKQSPYNSVEDYHAIFKQGRATPEQILTQVLKAARKLDSILRIFSSLDPDDVMKQARASTKRWKAGKPLSVFDGVPVAVKDMIEVAGHTIYDGGSRGYLCKRDDPIVRRFREAGAIILGLTVMTEGGTSPIGYNTHFKGPLNPYNKEYYTGGSSSGSGVAVSTGICPVAIGFDGGGSIRLPSSGNGIVGLATTFGRIPFEFDGTTFTTIKSGPMTGTVRDAALSFLLLADNDKADTDHFYSKLYGSPGLPRPSLVGFDQTHSLAGIRIGIFHDYNGHAEAHITEATNRTVRFLEGKGATVENIAIGNMRLFSSAHAISILSEFALIWDKHMTSGQEMESNTRITIALGKGLSSNELFASARLKTVAMDRMEKVFEKVDVIVTPMIAMSVPRIPDNARIYGEQNISVLQAFMRYVFLANLCGLPAMSVPMGYDADSGVPLGLQLLGNHWHESVLLRLANTLEIEGFLERRRTPEHFADVLQGYK